MLGGATERLYARSSRKCDENGAGSTLAPMRALVVTNMWPTADAPAARASSSPTRSRRCAAATTSRSTCSPSRPARARCCGRRRRCAAAPRGARYDVVHAHFGLSALPALAARLGPVVVTLHGNDLFVRRSNLVTRAALPFTALPAAVSRAFGRNLPGAGTSGGSPCCPWASRSSASARSRARRRARGSGLDPAGRYLLFPHDPARPLKRFDRAQEAAGDVPLLTMGNVPPDEVPYWINAANAVLVPRQDEGFGLSVIEALACGVPAFGDAGRHPSRRARRASTARSARRGTPARWRAALRARRSRRPIRGSTAARAPSCSPPTAWRRAWSRRGGAGPAAAAERRCLYSAFERVGEALLTDYERTHATHQALERRRRRPA